MIDTRPTLGELIFTHWKLTAIGACVGLLTFTEACTKLGIATWSQLFQFKTILAIIPALIPTALGILSKDSGTQKAILAGGQIAGVDSHEVPDDPAAKAVK